MEINYRKFLFITAFIFFFIGCTQTRPITWDERILDAKVEHLPLYYDEYGDKSNKTILFLHGFGENHHTWRFLVPKLALKYHLIMLDLKGFGDSPKLKDKAYSVYDQALLVNEFIKEKNLKDITLVGRSFGGGVALIMALIQEDKLADERIEKLVLINSMSYKQNLPSMMETLNQPCIGYVGIHLLDNEWIANEGYKYAFYNDSLIPEESVKATAAYLTFPLAKYAYLETVHQLIPEDISSIEKRYKEITLPTLILWGREDVSISVKKAYRLKSELKNSRLKVLPHVGHMPQEEKPDVVADEILKFMEQY
jgi:pimeloyl-ACP methyl ester carboxylesterase